MRCTCLCLHDRHHENFTFPRESETFLCVHCGAKLTCSKGDIISFNVSEVKEIIAAMCRHLSECKIARAIFLTKTSSEI